MSRTLPTGGSTAIARPSVHAVHLLRFTTRGITPVTFYFAESAQTIDGHPYLPYLRVEAGVRHTRSYSRKEARLALDNVDLETSALLEDHRDDLQGSVATFALYYLDCAGELGLIVDGEITSAEVDRGRGLFTLAALNLSRRQLPTRNYSPLCQWRWKQDGCLSQGNASACDRTFAACAHASRLATRYFSGMPSITRDLTEVVEGPKTDQPLGESQGSPVRGELMLVD